MQAIVTRFLPPTNTRGPRYKATCYAGSITVSAHPEFNVDLNHAFACAELCRKLAARNAEEYGETAPVWLHPVATGQIASGEYVHVFLD